MPEGGFRSRSSRKSSQGSRSFIDARTAEGVREKGHFPKAMNIPSEEMAVRYAEIPPGKAGGDSLLHRPGLKWPMMFSRRKGIKVQYLAANDEFALGNKWVIQE